MIISSITTQNLIDSLINLVVELGKDLLVCILIVFIGMKLEKWLHKVIKKSMNKANMEPIVIKFLLSLLKFAIYAVMLSMVIGVLGIPGSAFIAVLSTAGLAIGLALQGSLANFAGGILILLFKQFKIGDYIREDSHGNEGIVVGIDLFYTKLQSVDNKTIIIPNGTLANNSLSNFTAQQKRRIDIIIGISYNSDIKLAKDVLMNVLKDQESILPEEELVVYVHGLEDSRIEIGARAWVPTDLYWPVKWELTEKFKLALDENGIEIPFNQLSVTLSQNKE